MPTLFRVMEVDQGKRNIQVGRAMGQLETFLADEGVHAKMSQLQVKDVANKPIAPLSVDEVVRVTSKCMVPPFGHKVIHSRVGLVLQGYKMNVTTHGLERRSPLLLLGLEVQSAYATLATGSSRVPVVLRNNTKDWLEIKKGTPIARMVAAKLGPPGHQRRLSQGATPRLHLNGGRATGLAPGQVGFVRPRYLANRAGGKGSRPPEGVPQYLFP